MASSSSRSNSSRQATPPSRLVAEVRIRGRTLRPARRRSDLSYTARTRPKAVGARRYFASLDRSRIRGQAAFVRGPRLPVVGRRRPERGPVRRHGPDPLESRKRSAVGLDRIARRLRSSPPPLSLVLGLGQPHGLGHLAGPARSAAAPIRSRRVRFSTANDASTSWPITSSTAC